MMNPVLVHAAHVARKALNFAAPALVVGLLLGSQAYGIVYPPGAVGRTERAVDSLLAREQADILRENALIHTQNAIVGVINVLNQKLANAGSQAEADAIQAEINAKQVQFDRFQGLINTQSRILQQNLAVINPTKDRLLASLAGVGRNGKQARMFVTAATQRERTFVLAMRAFLKAHPVSPINPF